MISSRPRRSVRFCVLAIAFFCGALLVARAHATFVPPLSLADLWGNADCVIEATVDSTTCSWDAGHTMIWSKVYVNVLAVDLGPCVTGPRMISFLGGSVDSIGMLVVMAPTFTPGEHVMLFLDEHPNQLCPTIGMNQGKFTISLDASGRESFSNGRLRGIDRSRLLIARPVSGKGR